MIIHILGDIIQVLNHNWYQDSFLSVPDNKMRSWRMTGIYPSSSIQPLWSTNTEKLPLFELAWDELPTCRLFSTILQECTFLPFFPSELVTWRSSMKVPFPVCSWYALIKLSSYPNFISVYFLFSCLVNPSHLYPHFFG